MPLAHRVYKGYKGYKVNRVQQVLAYMLAYGTKIETTPKVHLLNGTINYGTWYAVILVYVNKENPVLLEALLKQWDSKECKAPLVPLVHKDNKDNKDNKVNKAYKVKKVTLAHKACKVNKVPLAHKAYKA